MISGATGALAVVMVGLVSNHGVEYLFATVVLMEIFQILAGVLRLGKFIRLVPHPALMGFVNGLAIVIFLAQLNQFKVRNAAGELEWMGGTRLALMLGLVAATFEWSSFRIMRNIPRSDAFVLVLVSGVTVFTDLAIAVGVVVSALVFAWESAKNIRYKNVNRSVHLRRLSPDCRDLFERAGNMVEVSVHKDPKYGVIMDYSPRF